MKNTGPRGKTDVSYMTICIIMYLIFGFGCFLLVCFVFFRTVFADSWCFMGLMRRRGEGGQTQHVLGRPHRARDPDEGKKREMAGETIRKEHKETKISKMK